MLCVKWTAIENQYSMVWRKPEKELFDVCEELGISFVAYSPLGNGFLSGKHTKNTKYDKNGKAMITSDDDWVDETAWDDLYEQMKKGRGTTDE